MSAELIELPTLWHMMPLASRVKYLREKKGYTKKKLADLAGCSKVYIWQLENGISKRPSAQKAVAIAKHLDVTVEELVG